MVTLALLYLEFITNILNSGIFDYIVTRKAIAEKMVNTCLLITTGASVAVAIVLGIVVIYLLDDYSATAKNIILAFLFYPVLIAYNSIQKALILRALLFKRLSLLRAPSVVISGIISVYLAYDGMGPWALVIYHYLQILLDIVFMSFLVLLLPTLEFSRLEAKRSISFSLPLLMSEVLNYWSSRVIELFVSLYFGPAIFAVLSVARKFSKLVEQLSLVALRSVFLSYITRAKNKGEEFAKFTAAVSFFVVPALISLGVYADHYIEFIFTEQWAPSVWVVKVIAFLALARCLMHHFNVFLIANNKSRWVLKTNIFFFAISVLSGALGFALSFEHFLILQVLVFNLIALLKLFYLLKTQLLSFTLVTKYFAPLVCSVVFFVVCSITLNHFIIAPRAEQAPLAFSLSIGTSIICFVMYLLFTRVCFSTFFTTALSKLTLDKTRSL